jgi:Trypsin-like peptidase domain
MFVNAIETVAQFIRPIHFITRNFDSAQVIPGAATLFFVNAEGWALTCGHVSDQIAVADQVNARHAAYRNELASLAKPNRDARRAVEKKYGFTAKTTVQIKARFMGCGGTDFQIKVRRHGHLDIALLKFSTTPQCVAYPRFARDGSALKQGKSLCRLGFPFPEFTNFALNALTDDIDWIAQGKEHTPSFPIEAMVTRHLADASGAVVGFEVSTPGLKGQSGGPAFDSDGVVWGMQSMTRHLDLDFDVDQEVLRRGVKERRRNSAFLHVGNCVHVDSLKEMMRDHGVSFTDA